MAEYLIIQRLSGTVSVTGTDSDDIVAPPVWKIAVPSQLSASGKIKTIKVKVSGRGNTAGQCSLHVSSDPNGDSVPADQNRVFEVKTKAGNESAYAKAYARPWNRASELPAPSQRGSRAVSSRTVTSPGKDDSREYVYHRGFLEVTIKR